MGATVGARHGGGMMGWVLAAGSYLTILVITVVVATCGRPRSLLGRSTDEGGGDYQPPDAIEKIVIVLYPLLLAFLAAIVWIVLWSVFWFGPRG